MKNILSIILLLIIQINLFAQPIKKANKQMKLYNYSKAIDLLLKAVNDKNLSNEAIPMLAMCYRIQHDPFKAKAWYKKAVELQNADPLWNYYYAQALMTTGDYLSAKEEFLKFAQMVPSDQKGLKYAAYCDSVMKPWQNLSSRFEVKTVKGINSKYDDFGPVILNQELVFTSDRIQPEVEGKKYGWTGRSFLDIYKSKPMAQGEFWGVMKSPSLLKGLLNQTYHDGPVAFTNNGKSAFFTRTFHDDAKKIDDIKTDLLKIYCSQNNGGKWGKSEPFFLNSTEYSVGHVTLTSDASTIFFISDMPGGMGGTDIWKCTLNGDKWGNPENIASLNTTENEMFPTLINDSILFFASEGWPGYGGLDIFMSRVKDGNWITPVNMHAPVNSSFDDFALTAAPGSDLNKLWNGFFSSNRPGGFGNDDIYAFRSLEMAPINPPIPEILVKKSQGVLLGYVKDKNKLTPVDKATVFILNPKTGKVKVVRTGPDGIYKLPVEALTNYVVKATKPGNISDCLQWSVDKIESDSNFYATHDLLIDELIVNKPFKIENIHYDFDKYNIRDDAKLELNKLVQIMLENPINIELGSHTDSRGSFKYNEQLSQKRAESAVSYLVQQGINQARITAKGYGESQLINICADKVPCTDSEHQANRRTEFKVTSYIVQKNSKDLFNPDLFREGEETVPGLMPVGFFNECQDK